MSHIKSLLAVAVVLSSMTVHAASQPAPQPETKLPGLCDLLNSMICDLQLAK